MNEITIVGTVAGAPRYRGEGELAVVRFDLVVNRERFNSQTREHDNRPAVFHRVIAFGGLARNVSRSVRPGQEVIVVGAFADDSYETDRGERHRDVVLEAEVVGVSLR